MEPQCFPKPNQVVSLPEPNHIWVRQRSSSMATGRFHIMLFWESPANQYIQSKTHFLTFTKWFVYLSLTRPETVVTASNWKLDLSFNISTVCRNIHFWTLIPVIGSCSALLKQKISDHTESPRLVAILGQGTMLLEHKGGGVEEQEVGFWHFHMDVEL